MSNPKKFKMKKGKIMTVTMEDGVVVSFFYSDGEAWFTLCNGAGFHSNEVDESSIQAVVGEPLSLSYYYGYGSREDIKTETRIKSIEYKDHNN